MGLFKSMKDLSEMTKSAKELQKQQLQEQGYGTGMKGQMAQMGDMISASKDMLSELTDQSGDRDRILAEGIDAEGVIVGMGTPARGAQWFNLNIDLEVRVPGRAPYRVNKQYLVPASAQLGQGVTLPIKVDPNDQAAIAIDWDRAAAGPAEDVVRPAGADAQAAAAQGFASTGPSTGSPDPVAQLEKLAKLRDSGALTDAEFEQQKAKILGS
jgi:hypothetical protein